MIRASTAKWAIPFNYYYLRFFFSLGNRKSNRKGLKLINKRNSKRKKSATDLEPAKHLQNALLRHTPWILNVCHIPPAFLTFHCGERGISLDSDCLNVNLENYLSSYTFNLTIPSWPPFWAVNIMHPETLPFIWVRLSEA